MKHVVMCKALATALTFFLLQALGCTATTALEAVQAKGNKKSITAIERTVKVLQDLVASNNKEKLDETLTFTRYKKFWLGVKAELDESISINAQTVIDMSAQISALQTEIEAIDVDLGKTNTDIETLIADRQAAFDNRKEQKEAFGKTQDDLNDALIKIERAINVIKEKPVKIKQKGAEALAQLANHPRLSEEAKATFNSFLAELNDDSDDDAIAPPPEAYGYENQSGGIIEMLANLRATFRKNLDDAQKEEMNRQHAYDMLMISLKDQLETLDRHKDDLHREKNNKMTKQAHCDKTMKAAQKQQDTDQKSHDDQLAVYNAKFATYSQNQQVRVEELEALNNCIDVLEGTIVAAGKQHFAIQFRQTSLSQFLGKSEAEMQKSSRRKVVDFIQQQAGLLKSKALLMLATKLHADPFSKVKNLIEDMIERLETEAENDKKQHEWCSREIKKSKIERTSLTRRIEGFTADMEELEADMYRLSETITTTTAEMDALTKSKTDAIEQWTIDKAALEQSILESAAALTAVADALKIMKDFYAGAKVLIGQGNGYTPSNTTGSSAVTAASAQSAIAAAAENTSFVQVSQAPVYEGAGYVGNADGASATALMSVIEADFEYLQKRLQNQLISDTSAHQKLINELDSSIEVKSKFNEVRTQDHQEAEDKHAEIEADRNANQQELASKETWFTKVKEDCMPKGMTFEEKLAKRQEEIESLTQALEILKDSSVNPEGEDM